MPTIKSSKKRLKQNKKRRQENKKRKNELREVKKRMEDLISAGETDQARQLLPEFMKKADKAETKGPYHKNKVARIKSKIMKKLDQSE